MPAGFPNESTYDALLRQAGDAAGVDWLFLKAIVAQESGFNPRAYRAEPARNDASRGLMQILYVTAQELGYTGTPEGLFEAGANIQYGAIYAGRQLRRYGGSYPDAAAAYNAGTAYQSNGIYTTKGGNPSVQHYVNQVLHYYALYQADAGIEAGEGPGAPSSPEEAPPGITMAATASEVNGGLLAEAEGAISGLWDTATAEFPAVAGWGWVALAAAGALAAWLLYEVIS